MKIEETSTGNLLLTISDGDKKVIEGIQAYNMHMYGENGFSMEDEKQFFLQSGAEYEFSYADKFGHLSEASILYIDNEGEVSNMWYYQEYQISSLLEELYNRGEVTFTRLI